MAHKNIYFYIDLVACFVFIPLVIMLLPIEHWFMKIAPWVASLVIYVYALYFVYRKIHLPQLILRKEYFTALAAIIVIVMATAVLTYIPFNIDFPNSTPRQMEIRQALKRQTFWFLFLIVSGFSLSIELAVELLKQILSKQEMEARKDKAELMLYKSQINPHFLFNTLNTLYALVLSHSDKTESAFIQFSNILRYAYSQVGEEKIPIAKEIDYIQQYVELQKLRLNKHTDVQFVHEIDDMEQMIPPMILITFIENAFKYGTSSEKNCYIKILIWLKEGTLYFETQNSIMRKSVGIDGRTDDGDRVGLENCYKRLNLLYADRYSIHIDNKDGIYHSKLIIHLK